MMKKFSMIPAYKKSEKQTNRLKSEEKTYPSIKPKTSHTLPAVQIVRREMLTASRSLEMATDLKLPSFIRISLNPSHIRHGVFPCHQWVFPRCLLPSPPSWVPENVYVWCPKCHPCRLSRIVHRSSFSSDRLINHNS